MERMPMLGGFSRSSDEQIAASHLALLSDAATVADSSENVNMASPTLPSIGAKRIREDFTDSSSATGKSTDEPEQKKAMSNKPSCVGASSLAPISLLESGKRRDEVEGMEKGMCDDDTKLPSLSPPPFFFYRDYSRITDDDPLTPLTAPARVPNFPAKMHAILSRPDLADVIAWMPHGRSWRVLKPREFEIRVIPTYFEHSKFSSFIRQANGWGFRRITQGRDRNSYYNELFLRGLPHLCKKMRRPGVSEKPSADPEHEPDFYKITEMYPLPQKAEDDESILLASALQGGPKARMPVHYGSLYGTGTVSASMIPSCKSSLSVQKLDSNSHSSAGLTTHNTPHKQQGPSNVHSTYSLFHKSLQAASAQMLHQQVIGDANPRPDFSMQGASNVQTQPFTPQPSSKRVQYPPLSNPNYQHHYTPTPHFSTSATPHHQALETAFVSDFLKNAQSAAAASHLNAAASHLRSALNHALALSQSPGFMPGATPNNHTHQADNTGNGPNINEDNNRPPHW